MSYNIEFPKNLEHYLFRATSCTGSEYTAAGVVGFDTTVLRETSRAIEPVLEKIRNKELAQIARLKQSSSGDDKARALRLEAGLETRMQCERQRLVHWGQSSWETYSKWEQKTKVTVSAGPASGIVIENTFIFDYETFEIGYTFLKERLAKAESLLKNEKDQVVLIKLDFTSSVHRFILQILANNFGEKIGAWAKQKITLIETKASVTIPNDKIPPLKKEIESIKKDIDFVEKEHTTDFNEFMNKLKEQCGHSQDPLDKYTWTFGEYKSEQNDHHIRIVFRNCH